MKCICKETNAPWVQFAARFQVSWRRRCNVQSNVVTSLYYIRRPVVRHYVIRSVRRASGHVRACVGPRPPRVRDTNTGPDGRRREAKSALSSGKTPLACSVERESRVGLRPPIRASGRDAAISGRRVADGVATPRRLRRLVTFTRIPSLPRC